MAISKIQYDTKVAINIDSTIPDINKCNASDLNEIKSVVNNNADEIPTKTSDLTNDSGYITKDANDLTNYTKTSDLSSVATSGSYNDLIDKPTIPSISDSYGTSTTNGYSQNYINENTLNPSGEPSTTQSNVSSATFFNTLEAPMNIDLKGNTLQNGTPTPSSPIPVNVVSGDNDIVVSNGASDTTTYNIDLPVENLFDKDNANIMDATINSSTKLIESSNQYKMIYIPCKPNTTYTISKVQSGYLTMGFTDALPTTNVEVKNYTNSADTTKCTETSLSTSKYIVLRYYRINDTLTESEIRATIQIEYGSKPNTYTPYGTTPIELNKIGTYQDYIYKENDKLYLHKEIGKYVFDGTENWTTSAYGTNSWAVNNLFTIPYDASKILIISNIFKGVSNDDRSTSGDNILHPYANNGFIIRNTTLTSKTNVQNATKDNYVYYVLTTPTNTEITYTPLINQLESIKNAMSKKGTTNVNQVNNDAPFILDLSVFNDTYNGRYEGLKQGIENNKSEIEKNKNSIEDLQIANTYSTNEQVIGKWIDGKPIYRIVYQGTTDSSEVSSWTTLFSINNLDSVVDMKGNFDGYSKGPIPRYESTSYRFYLSVAGTNIQYRQTGYNSANFHLVVEYTKTTD